MKTCVRALIGFLILVMTPVTFAQDEAEGSSGRVCLNIRNISSFNPVDNEFLYVRATGKKHYLFTMQRSCIGLHSTNEIAIVDPIGSACSNTMPKVVYEDWGRGNTSCRVLNIEEVVSYDDAKELAKAHKEERRDRRSDDQ